MNILTSRMGIQSTIESVWFDNGRLAYRIRLSSVTMPLEDIVRQVEQNGWTMKITGNKFDEEKK